MVQENVNLSRLRELAEQHPDITLTAQMAEQMVATYAHSNVGMARSALESVGNGVYEISESGGLMAGMARGKLEDAVADITGVPLSQLISEIGSLPGDGIIPDAMVQLAENVVDPRPTETVRGVEVIQLSASDQDLVLDRDVKTQIVDQFLEAANMTPEAAARFRESVGEATTLGDVSTLATLQLGRGFSVDSAPATTTALVREQHSREIAEETLLTSAQARRLADRWGISLASDDATPTSVGELIANSPVVLDTEHRDHIETARYSTELGSEYLRPSISSETYVALVDSRISQYGPSVTDAQRSEIRSTAIGWQPSANEEGEVQSVPITVNSLFARMDGMANQELSNELTGTQVLLVQSAREQEEEVERRRAEQQSMGGQTMSAIKDLFPGLGAIISVIESVAPGFFDNLMGGKRDVSDAPEAGRAANTPPAPQRVQHDVDVDQTLTSMRQTIEGMEEGEAKEALSSAAALTQFYKATIDGRTRPLNPDEMEHFKGDLQRASEFNFSEIEGLGTEERVQIEQTLETIHGITHRIEQGQSPSDGLRAEIAEGRLTTTMAALQLREEELREQGGEGNRAEHRAQTADALADMQADIQEYDLETMSHEQIDGLAEAAMQGERVARRGGSGRTGERLEELSDQMQETINGNMEVHVSETLIDGQQMVQITIDDDDTGRQVVTVPGALDELGMLENDLELEIKTNGKTENFTVPEGSSSEQIIAHIKGIAEEFNFRGGVDVVATSNVEIADGEGGNSETSEEQDTGVPGDDQAPTAQAPVAAAPEAEPETEAEPAQEETLPEAEVAAELEEPTPETEEEVAQQLPEENHMENMLFGLQDSHLGRAVANDAQAVASAGQAMGTFGIAFGGDVSRAALGELSPTTVGKGQERAQGIA